MKRKVLTLLMLLLAGCLVSCSYSGPGEGYYYSKYYNTEEYTDIEENPFVETAEKSESYFSMDVNTASYSNIRRLINNGSLIEKDAVRIEEMLNYFQFDYEEPAEDETLKISSFVSDCPWNSENKLLTIGVKTKTVDLSNISNNFVFLIDISGSMSAENKLPLAKTGLKMLASSLTANDRLSIVTYASGVSVKLSGESGANKNKINNAIDKLAAKGATAGSQGIQKAYEIAGQNFIEGGNNRIILVTDGDFNVGISNTSEL